MNVMSNRSTKGYPRLAVRAMRRSLLMASQAATSTAQQLRQQAARLDIHLNCLDQPIAIKAIADIPVPHVDLASDDPIAAIMAAPKFTAVTTFFSDNPVTTRSLVSPQAQALLFCLIRNLRPDHVFEIGCFQAGTTEAVCRALHANGSGMAHTVDPFCGEQIKAVFKCWPPELLRRVQLYATDSMPFYWEQEQRRIKPGLVFVDGNHQYEYALFDIGCAARAVTPAGFIVVDNIAQAGPFFAARDFLATNPGWRELGSSIREYNRDKAFDPHRTTIVNTDFMVLRAPTHLRLNERPVNFGVMPWQQSSVAGIHLKFLPPDQPGMLNVQAVLRGFGAQLAETLGETTAEVAPNTEELSLTFTPAAQLTGQYTSFTVEPWLIWRGPGQLRLVGPPKLY